MDDAHHRGVGTPLHPVTPRRGPRRGLAAAPWLTVAAFALPVGTGLVGTLLPAFGILPALGRTEPSLAPWRELVAQPGFATACASR